MSKVRDKIYIDLDKEWIDPNILVPLTYDNPEYYSKMNMGISVYKIPKILKTYEMEGRELRIMRGEVSKILPYLKEDFEFEHSDHPISLQYINNDFNLDEYQEEAIITMKNKRQGIIHAVTSAGKSLMIAKSIVEIGQRTLIIVHRKVLMQQILEDIDKYIRNEKGEKIKVGKIGDGKFDIQDITIGIDKSISKRLSEVKENFGCVILDECHIAPADTLFKIANSINSKYRFGFSGTLKRKDQKDFLIFATFGMVIYTINKEQLLDKGRVVPVVPEIIYSDTKFDWDSVVTGLTESGSKNPTTEARFLQEKTISLDFERNHLILRTVSKLKGKTIVLCRYVEPCYKLQDALRLNYGIESGVITGRDSKEALESYKQMKHGDMQVIFATIGCVSTGVSISDLDNIVLISPLYTNELLIKQIVGRLMRTAKGKTHGTLYFVYDQYIFPKSKLSKFINIVNK